MAENHCPSYIIIIITITIIIITTTTTTIIIRLVEPYILAVL